VLQQYPDFVADSLLRFRTATIEKDRVYAKSYLEIKAQSAGEKITVVEIDATIKASAEWYAAAMEEVKAESDWTRKNETLMASKKAAALKGAF
jgi:hypothetical protein